MPSASPAAVRAQIAKGTPATIYLIVGDDDVEMSRLASDFSSLVDEGLLAFNVERLYASDRNVSPASIVEAARLLPMMADRRVVVVLRAERLLKPKRRGAADEDAAADEGAAGGADVLEAYIREPEPRTVLVFVASDIDRTRRLSKALLKTATIVECWGLKDGRDDRVDLRQAARHAEQLVRQAVSDAGQQIDPAAARLIAERAGADIATLRGDVERLLLYAAGRPRITLADVGEIVSAETSQDDWAVTSAIQRRDAPEALRQLGLALEAGGVPYMILGQLAWYVRERMAGSEPRSVPQAVEALFRTDLDLKSSGGDPRVLLERLVVELCGPSRAKPSARQRM
ncbi:MAG TPA: DNA polymerase III subunit delta [Vicinamibacterales bacterium]|nr:DNA polymerase III subunit delta [Vicinamibacterales bacterium]